MGPAGKGYGLAAASGIPTPTFAEFGSLPVVRPVVRRFDIEVGHCSQCQRRVQGHHVLQTSDALGAAGVQLGPGVVALVVELHTEMGVPLAKVAHLLRTTFGLQVTPGGLAHVLHRAARAAAPAYAELCEQVRNAPVVTPDETGWRVGGVRHWLWAFVTPDTTVYAICPGRGFNDAATVLGTDYAGVLVRDGWAQPPGGIGMSVWLVTPRSLVAIGLLSAAVIGCAPAGTTALNDAVDIVAVILRRVPMIDHGVPLDTSATLPDGTVFDGPAELRARLRSRREAFVRTVTSKLLTYALGRGVEHYDQPTIRRIVREAGPDHPWSSIVLGIVRSVPFTMRRSEP